jgi:hypothetical protein
VLAVVDFTVNVLLWKVRADGGVATDPCKKTYLFFECFPYVCPEPVLVK